MAVNGPPAEIFDARGGKLLRQLASVPCVVWCFGHDATVELRDTLVDVESVVTSAAESIVILRLRKPRDGQEYGVELRLPSRVVENIRECLAPGMTLAEIGNLDAGDGVVEA
jgi:hypothetical protein